MGRVPRPLDWGGYLAIALSAVCTAFYTMSVIGLVDVVVDRCKHQGQYPNHVKLASHLFRELLEESKGLSFTLTSPTLIIYGDIGIIPTDEPGVMVKADRGAVIRPCGAKTVDGLCGEPIEFIELTAEGPVWAHVRREAKRFAHVAVPPGEVQDYLHIAIFGDGSAPIVFSCDGTPKGLKKLIAEMEISRSSLDNATFYRVHGKPVNGAEIE